MSMSRICSEYRLPTFETLPATILLAPRIMPSWTTHSSVSQAPLTWNPISSMMLFIWFRSITWNA